MTAQVNPAEIDVVTTSGTFVLFDVDAGQRIFDKTAIHAILPSRFIVAKATPLFRRNRIIVQLIGSNWRWNNHRLSFRLYFHWSWRNLTRRRCSSSPGRLLLINSRTPRSWSTPSTLTTIGASFLRIRFPRHRTTRCRGSLQYIAYVI